MSSYVITLEEAKFCGFLIYASRPSRPDTTVPIVRCLGFKVDGGSGFEVGGFFDISSETVLDVRFVNAILSSLSKHTCILGLLAWWLIRLVRVIDASQLLLLKSIVGSFSHHRLLQYMYRCLFMNVSIDRVTPEEATS